MPKTASAVAAVVHSPKSSSTTILTFSINDKSTLISCTLGTRGTGNYYIYCQEPAEKKTNEENERRRGKGKECKMGSNYNLILDISASMI